LQGGIGALPQPPAQTPAGHGINGTPDPNCFFLPFTA
jgi:hypothetical protein